MFGFLADFIPTVAAGGLTAILGTVVSSGAKIINDRQNFRHELALRKLDIEHTKIEASMNARAAAIEAEGASEQAAWGAFEESFREAATRWSRGDSKWLVAVDIVRGLMRPSGAFLFLAATIVIYFYLSEDDAAVRERIIHSVVYLTETSWLWWYGTRQMDKRSGK